MKKFSYLLILLITIIIFVGCDFSLSNKNKLSNEALMKVHFIDVGQGDSILVQINNINMLIDSGPGDGKDKLLHYLKTLNISTLDYVIATHPHEDHIGNMSDVIKKFNVTKFYAPKVESTTKSFEQMVESLVNKNLKINVIKAGTDSINLGENTKVTVLSPNSNNYGDNLNNYSPIIKVQYGKTSFLFTGDAEKESENEVLAKNFNIKADVLKIGHHGSSTSTTKKFLNSVNPSFAIISLGVNNKYGHPNKDITSLLDSNKTKIYRTDIDGTILLMSDGVNITK